MLKLATVSAALVALAASQCSEAATTSGVPLSLPVAGSGLTVTDQSSPAPELSKPLITFSRSLGISVTVDSTVTTVECAVTDLSYQWATLTLVDPKGIKSDLGSISNSDIYGGQDCSGHHSRTKSFTVAGAKGQYVLVLVVNTLVNRRPKTGPYFIYPSIRIEADGMAAVDRSFPSYGDQAQITQVFPIVFK